MRFLAPALFCGLLFAQLTAQQVELEELVVIASRLEEKPSQTAGTSSALTARELLASGATNLTDAFKYEPGVSVPFDFAGSDGLVPFLSGGDQGINIRGLEGNRITLTIDGIRQPEDFVVNSFQGAGGPGRIYFDPAVFSQIELYKSAASSLYGSDALGGAVSAQTESALTLLGPEIRGAVLQDTITWSSANESLHNRFAHAAGNGTTAYSILHSYRKGQERVNNSPAPPNPLDFESNAFVATLNWRPNDQWLFTATGDYYLLDSFADLNSAENINNQGIRNDLVTSDDQRKRLRFSLDSIHTPIAVPLYDALKTSLYWQRATSRTDNVQQGIEFGNLPRNRLNEIEYDTSIAGVQLQADKALSSHQISYGLDASLSQVESSFLRSQFFDGFDPFLEDRIGMAPSDVFRAGVFLRNQITLGSRDQWQITPSVRFDHYSIRPDNTVAFLARTETTTGESVEAPDYDNFAISPSLSFLYNFTDQFNLYGSWSQGTRNPSAEEIGGAFTHGSDFIVVPNPDLGEERSNSFEIGLQYSSEVLNAQLSGYYNFYQGFFENNVDTGVDTVDGTDILTTVNRGEAEIYGFEFTADWLIGESISALEGLALGGSFSWTEGIANDGSGSPEQPLNSVEPWRAVSYLAYNSPEEKWGSRLTATYTASKDASDIDFSNGSDFLIADSWFTLDLTAYYAISENIRLRSGVTNLLDEEYVLWATARRGTGHGNDILPLSFFSQPGRAFFVSCDFTF